jgi:hypothetical protein
MFVVYFHKFAFPVNVVSLIHDKWVPVTIQLFTAPCSGTVTFVNTPGRLLMGRLTTRLIAY